jgi:hypothetical protein
VVKKLHLMITQGERIAREDMLPQTAKAIFSLRASHRRPAKWFFLNRSGFCFVRAGFRGLSYWKEPRVQPVCQYLRLLRRQSNSSPPCRRRISSDSIHRRGAPLHRANNQGMGGQKAAYLRQHRSSASLRGFELPAHCSAVSPVFRLVGSKSVIVKFVRCGSVLRRRRC